MDDKQKLQYVFRYFFYLTNRHERLAYTNLGLKAKNVGSNAHVKQLSNDPQVLLLEAGGLEEFQARTARRIMADHADKVFFNYCPACNALARTPRARQCRFCGHDWHHSGDSK
jgi:hypothetical protein